MKISKEDLRDLIHGDAESDDWMVVQDEITGTWRWGNNHTVILQKDTSLWGYNYQVQGGDNYYNSVDDEGDEVELYPVDDEVECKTVYKRRS